MHSHAPQVYAPQLGDAPESDLDLASYDPEKFTFVRIVYDSTGGYGQAYYRGDQGGWTPRWATDHPDGAKNLTWRLNQLTTIKANEGSLLLRLTDPRLFDFPFIFMSDPGWQELQRDERVALRRYLEKGGFLWVDDFWGQAEWDNLARNNWLSHQVGSGSISQEIIRYFRPSIRSRLPASYSLPVLQDERCDL